MVDCHVALACPSRFFGATDQAVKADTSDYRICLLQNLIDFGSILKHRLVFERPEWLVCLFNDDCFGRYLEASLHDSCKAGLCVKVAATGYCGFGCQYVRPLQ
jgi:hypothetical protein